MHSKSSNEQPIRNQQSLSVDVEDETDNEILEQLVASDLQPSNAIEGQITDEGVVAEIYELMMQENSVPFCFEAFQFLKQNPRNISKVKDEQPVGCHTVSMDTLQQSSQVCDDLIAHVLDDVCCKKFPPLANHVPENNVDDNLIQKFPSLSCLTDFLLQSSHQGLQSYEEINKGDFCSVWNQQRSLVFHEFQDPFDSLLQSPKKSTADVRKSLRSRYGDYLDQSYVYEDPFAVFLQSSSQFMLCKFISSPLGSKFPWELPFSSYFSLFISKHLGRNQTKSRMLTWLHWMFHYT